MISLMHNVCFNTRESLKVRSNLKTGNVKKYLRRCTTLSRHSRLYPRRKSEFKTGFYSPISGKLYGDHQGRKTTSSDRRNSVNSLHSIGFQVSDCNKRKIKKEIIIKNRNFSSFSLRRSFEIGKRKRKKKNFDRIHSHEHVTVLKFQKTRKNTHTTHPTNTAAAMWQRRCLFLWMKKQKAKKR